MSEDFITQVGKMIEGKDFEITELREVNAELLGILKHIISSYELTDSDLFESESAIAKAEALK